jgi:hypothetical protein
MENKKKKQLGWFAFCFVTFHVGCILVATFPLGSKFKGIQNSANAYAKPLFKHNWNMFSPCPLTDNTLSFRINYAQDTTNLITPSKLNGPAHSLYRCSYHGSLISGEYNMLYWVKSDIDRINLIANENNSAEKQNKFKKNGNNLSRGYFMLKNYLNGYARNLGDKPPKSFDVYCHYFNVKYNRMDTYYFKQLK